MEKQFYVYILANKSNRVLYTGVTNNIIRRVFEHRERRASAFTTRYRVDKLVYFEVFQDISEAIEREKQIKAGSRKKKIELVEQMNLDWKDLYDEVCGNS
jgi:putative endonuclease